jgi:phospholipase B1, membrane-associated
MMKDSSIDFRNDWKMITIFFGANDICSLECFNKTAGSAAGYMNSLMKALDYLQDAMPRTFINLIPVIGMIV